MARFHINGEGNVGKCTATVGECPFGGASDHFPNEAVARTEYERRNAYDTLNSITITDLENKIGDTTEVKLEVLPHQLRVGDVVPGKGVVEEIKSAKKNIYVSFDGKNPKAYSRENPENINIVRSESTESAVKARKDMSYAISSIEELRIAKINFDKNTAEFSEKITSGENISSFDYKRLMDSRAEFAIWKRVESIAGENKVSIPEATAMYADTLRENIYSRLKTGESRSTSQVSNVLEDIENEKILHFIQKYSEGGKRSYMF